MNMRLQLRRWRRQQDDGTGIGKLHAMYTCHAIYGRVFADIRQKFQDLEEERLDFTKSSLWTFANIASTVCVSDDAVSLLLCLSERANNG